MNKSFLLASVLGLLTLMSGAALAKPSLAVDQALSQVLPLSPAQVYALKAKNTALTQAMQAVPIQASQLSATVKTVDLSDSASPALLHLVAGYTTTVSFIGANGSAWPILTGVSGGRAVSLIQPSKADPYTAVLVVNQAWQSTNVSFYLKGRVKPVTLYLTTASDTRQGLDGNVTVKLNGLPPGTTPTPIKSVIAVSEALLNALNHSPGSNWQAVGLNASDLPVRVHYWLAPDHHHVIVRLSNGTLVMPQWASQASTPDQTATAYEFDHVPLMLWVDSNDGQSFQLRVKQATQLIAGGQTSLTVRPAGKPLMNQRGALYVK